MLKPNTVLIASVEETVANGLRGGIEEKCRELGLRLLTGPAAGKPYFDNKDELFSYLSEIGPVQLADTLVFLYIESDYAGCFASRASGSSQWHKHCQSSTGVGLELVLRFPQAFPVFLGSGGRDLEDWLAKLLNDSAVPTDHLLPEWHRLHFVNPLRELPALNTLLVRFNSGLRMTFDPTGLRTLLRNRFIGSVFGKGADWSNSLKARKELSSRLRTLTVVIDEEPDMAMFAAYSTYKFGARSWMVTTYKALKEEGFQPTWHDPAAKGLMIIRDIDLRFPDYPNDPLQDEDVSHRIQLKNIYSDAWKPLVPPGSTVRVMSHEHNIVEKEQDWDGESLRLGQSKTWKPVTYYGLKKPLKSIYAAKVLLKSEAVLELMPVPDEMQKGDAHAAPYDNLSISWDLLEQAEECQTTSDLKTCILQAFLAQEAYSLLLGMSPTSSLRAIREMALAEATAEGEWAGVLHALRTRERRHDLEKTVANLLLADRGANFLAKLWAELRAVYKETEQFEASEEANAESLVYSKWLPRWLRRSDKVQLKWLKRALLAPMRSLYALFACLLVWAFLLTALHIMAYGWTEPPERGYITGFLDLYRHVLNSIIRPEAMNFHEIDVSDTLTETALKAIVDTLMAGSSLMFVGLVVTVLFRRSTRG